MPLRQLQTHYPVCPGGGGRNARKAEPGNHQIIVLPGEYYLTKPFELDSRDNGLTIEADTSGIATLYGGTRVSNWHRDGEKFWCADLPGVKEGAWDFRALVVEGRMPERARTPESGTFLHLNIFDILQNKYFQIIKESKSY